MKVSSRCYAVTGLGYSAPWCVNAGFIAGDEVTLIIDTGGNAFAAATIHGYATSVRPSNALRVINTEKHFDHVGGNSFFRERGVKIWGHESLSRTAEEFAAEVDEFNNGIANPVRRSRGEARVFFHNTTLAMPDHQISGEITFDLGVCCAAVILTPGHTATNLSVWVEHDRVLFTGDCMISEYLPNLDAGSPREWKKWLNSLDRVESLKPQVVVCGHGPVLIGSAVEQSIRSLRTVLQESISSGHSPTNPPKQ